MYIMKTKVTKFEDTKLEVTGLKVTIADFFSDYARKQALQKYQNIYQKIKALSAPNLMPYIALKEALAKLI